MRSSLEWPSGYGPPPEPPPRDYSSQGADQSDDRLKNRFEACRSGMQELNNLRQKHTIMIQNLRARLPIIPGSIDDVQTREKKSRDGFLDRFSLQSVDSGVSSQNTINSTRSSSPDDFSISMKNPHNRHSNIYENSTGATMNYSTFRKLSLESTCNRKMPVDFAPPVITSRSCHRGAWKTSPKRVRPKSMFDTTTTSNEYLFEKPPRHPIDLTRERRSAFTVISPSMKRHSIDPTMSMSQMTLNEQMKMKSKPVIRTPQKPEVIRMAKVEKADTMFRANVVYLSSSEHQNLVHPGRRFSSSRSPPARRSKAQLIENNNNNMPCKIRSPKLNSNRSLNNCSSSSIFSAKPISIVRTSVGGSPKIAHHSTWLQSQPL